MRKSGTLARLLLKGVLTGFFVTRKEEKNPLKQKLTAIDRSRKSRCRTKSARPLRDVRFRTISLDASSEKFRGQPAFNQKENSKAGCPPIASYCTTWFTTGDALFAEKVSPKY